MQERGHTQLPTAAKTRFHLETEMSNPVIRWMRRSGLTVKPEFFLPWGICDLVGVILDPARIQKRLSYGQNRSIGPPARVRILSRIPEHDSGRSISLRKLKRDFLGFFPADVLERELRTLSRDRFVTSPRIGFFQKRNGWAPLHQRIVAVELKLTRLSEAVAQATSNRSFATHSYVALPGQLALRISKSGRAKVFKQEGIGLLAVWHRSCRILLEASARPSLHDEVIQSHVVERFWRTRDS